MISFSRHSSELLPILRLVYKLAMNSYMSGYNKTKRYMVEIDHLLQFMHLFYLGNFLFLMQSSISIRSTHKYLYFFLYLVVNYIMIRLYYFLFPSNCEYFLGVTLH